MLSGYKFCSGCLLVTCMACHVDKNCSQRCISRLAFLNCVLVYLHTHSMCAVTLQSEFVQVIWAQLRLCVKGVMSCKPGQMRGWAKCPTTPMLWTSLVGQSFGPAADVPVRHLALLRLSVGSRRAECHGNVVWAEAAKLIQPNLHRKESKVFCGTRWARWVCCAGRSFW